MTLLKSQQKRNNYNNSQKRNNHRNQKNNQQKGNNDNQQKNLICYNCEKKDILHRIVEEKRNVKEEKGIIDAEDVINMDIITDIV